MKLLITGSNGFVGSYFIDKYSDTYDIVRFSFLHDTLHDLQIRDVDVVIHLSALVHQMGGASAEEYERVNVTQTSELAKIAKEAGVKQFVFMSTVKVYGEETDNVYTEKSPCNPEDEYGKSKLKAERELQKLEDESFIVSIIRTPIIYGYGVKANIKNLINLVKKVPILPFGDIQNRRSMTYIGNLCHLIDELIKQRTGGIFLASDDKPISTTEFIRQIAKNLDKKTYLIKVPFFESLLKLLKPSFHKRLYGSLEIDNKLTKEKLDLKNPYSTQEGISLMIGSKK
ncbi:MAG: NAD-dependent epimerase/dehydratase family protein [Sulfurospirillaceae bacterium]|nr:NAD-dependent epimerase/dehydratase family protein [Sulfurospirillaceae bacterium]